MLETTWESGWLPDLNKSFTLNVLYRCWFNQWLDIKVTLVCNDWLKAVKIVHWKLHTENLEIENVLYNLIWTCQFQDIRGASKDANTTRVVNSKPTLDTTLRIGSFESMVSSKQSFSLNLLRKYLSWKLLSYESKLSTKEISAKMLSKHMVKLIRAQGGCLGTKSRRKTW